MNKLFLFLCFWAMLSCERAEDDSFSDNYSSVIVIEGKIVNKMGYSYVKISKSKSSPNQEAEPISGAVVTVFNNSESFTFTESTLERGYYLPNSVDKGTVGRKYFLQVQYNGQTYIANDSMLDVSSFSPLIYQQVSETQVYQIQFVALAYHTSESAQYEIDVLRPSPLLPSKLYYYTLKTLDINDIFSPAQEKVTFPKNTLLVEKKYSISETYENYLREMLMETSWTGGFYDVGHANPKTNLSSGALGYFSAQAIIIDSVWVE